MKGKRTIRPEEKALWRKVARSVTPLSEDRRRALEADDPSSPAETEPPASGKAKLKSSSAPVRPSRPHGVKPPHHHHIPTPHDRSAEKRVRRGRVEIDARIDLHGLTQDQALSSLRHFLSMAHASGYRTVLVITGKGLKAREREAQPWEYPDEPGVLRRKLGEWLGMPEFKPLVSGYAAAHARHGGSGAFYVTLRVRPKT